MQPLIEVRDLLRSIQLELCRYGPCLDNPAIRWLTEVELLPDHRDGVDCVQTRTGKVWRLFGI